MKVTRFRPLFLGLLGGALAVACNIYELPTQFGAGLSGNGGGGAAVSLVGGNGGESSTGGNSSAGATISRADATTGPDSAGTITTGSDGADRTGDAQPGTASDGAPDAAISSDASGGPVLALPFVVDSYFRPTGYMGDGITPGPLVVQTTGCKLPRPQGAKGNCYKITYKPKPPDGGPAWSGLYWQYPDNNWGATIGRRIVRGATKVTFYAASESGLDVVTFRAGGIQNAGSPHQDTLKVDLVQPLSTTLTQYSVDLTGQSYDEVLGPFAWLISTYDPSTWAAAAPPMVIYLDDIRWE